MSKFLQWFYPTDDMSPLKVGVLLLIVAVELVLAYCLAQQNNPFFYQAF
ncbi:MAG TPA: hypothetical protein VMD30_08900 [Tepidisphaeraceae bacterium]|nr:hypothetical protein [Tepidisphaeraceae bacterium]